MIQVQDIHFLLGLGDLENHYLHQLYVKFLKEIKISSKNNEFIMPLVLNGTKEEFFI